VPDWVKDLVDNWLESAGISNGRIFRRLTRAGTVWGSSLTERSFGMLLDSMREKLASTNLHPTISGELAPGLAIKPAVNSTRFSFYLGMSRCRQPSDILAANSGFAMPSTIGSAYSRNAEWIWTASGRMPTIRSEPPLVYFGASGVTRHPEPNRLTRRGACPDHSELAASVRCRFPIVCCWIAPDRINPGPGPTISHSRMRSGRLNVPNFASQANN